MDYKQLPFKCRFCHSHRHFAKYCKKKDEEDAEKSKEQWIQAQNTASTKKNSRKKGKDTSMGSDAPAVRKKQEKGNKDQSRAEAKENPFETLRVEEDNSKTVTEEIEQQPLPSTVEKETIKAPHQKSQIWIYSSPTYAEITRKKVLRVIGI